VDVGFDRAVEANLVVVDRAVGKCQPQPRRAGIGPRADLDHRPGDELVDQPPAFVDHVEPPVLGDAVLSQLDRLA